MSEQPQHTGDELGEPAVPTSAAVDAPESNQPSSPEPTAPREEHAVPREEHAVPREEHAAQHETSAGAQEHARETNEPEAVEPEAVEPKAVVAEEEELEDVTPLEDYSTEPEEPVKKSWYILKVQVNREDSIREGLQRRVSIAGLDKYFGDIIVPTEMVSEFKAGKKRVVKRKLYPGYLVVHMEINEDTWFLVRETPGIGDFTGSAGKPTPMSPQEVARIMAKADEKSDEQAPLDIKVKSGERVKINEGTFENFEGEVDTIDQASGRVTVMINIFGRSTPVELEYWQIERI